MDKLVFTTILTPKNADDALLFFESLRKYGGELAGAPIHALTPRHTSSFTKPQKELFDSLNVEQLFFHMDEEAYKFPFASLVYAAGLAEMHLRGKIEALVWMMPDSLVINPPTDFLLPKGVKLAYRPVHHTLIGSIYKQPLDKFWSLIYQHCQVPEHKVFPMETCVGDHILRPYLNAGMLVVRPELGLLTTWWDRFESLYHHADFIPLYLEDERYTIFMHQAVLAGVAMVMLEKNEMLELPSSINYPLNLHHSEMPAERQPKTLNDLVTCRTEGIENLKENLKGIEVKEPLKEWLDGKLKISD